MNLCDWSPNEILKKVRRRTGYYKREYIRQYPDLVSSSFIWIPKNGGTSMYYALKEFGMLYLTNKDMVRFYFPQHGLVSFGYLKYSFLLEHNYIKASFHKQAFKFCIARNPYDRAVSTYFYFIAKGWLNKNVSFVDFTEQLTSLDLTTPAQSYTGSKGYVYPQYDYISDDKGLVVDFVAHLESMDVDVQTIKEQLKLDFNYPRVNTTQHAAYQSYYNEHARLNIYKVYEKDFDILGYSSAL